MKITEFFRHIFKKHKLPIFVILVFLVFLSFKLFHKVNAVGEFITTWQTTTDSESITIPTFVGETYNYDVNWGDGEPDDIGVVGDATHTYATAGTYTVTITGTFPRIYFFNGGASIDKILSVDQWGSIAWTSMNYAFALCSNLEINASDVPDLSNVTDMSFMFYEASSVNQDISSWDVSNVTAMNSMFQNATAFNQPLNDWDVSNVTDMNYMFTSSAFNQDISSWDVSNVTNMSAMFSASAFNQDISSWIVSSVTDMSGMFLFNSVFNQPLDSWIVSSVLDMGNMFRSATSFNQDISSWDVSGVTNMNGMFYTATVFNQPLDAWGAKTSNVTNMGNMFRSATSFNQPLNSWIVSSVTTMVAMFAGATAFNQPLSNWDVSSVLNMNSVFQSASSFNQPLNSWDVSSATNMYRMFYNDTAFNQDISSWDISGVLSMTGMFFGDTLSTNNYDALLIAWSALSLQAGILFDGGNSFYCTSFANRGIIISDSNWTITDAGLIDCYTLVYTAGSNGSITGDTSQTVDTGNDGTAVTAVPNDHYHFVDWSDGVLTATRTDTSITSNLSVTANFAYTNSNSGSGSYLPGYGPQATNPISVPIIPPTEITVIPNSEQIIENDECSPELIITDNLKIGARDGEYSYYNKGVVKQVSILQAYINKILTKSYYKASGPVDGIFSTLTKQGVKRLQKNLNTILKPTPLLKIDGIVGVFTKSAINNSCGKL